MTGLPRCFRQPTTSYTVQESSPDLLAAIHYEWQTILASPRIVTIDLKHSLFGQSRIRRDGGGFTVRGTPVFAGRTAHQCKINTDDIITVTWFIPVFFSWITYFHKHKYVWIWDWVFLL